MSSVFKNCLVDSEDEAHQLVDRVDAGSIDNVEGELQPEDHKEERRHLVSSVDVFCEFSAWWMEWRLCHFGPMA